MKFPIKFLFAVLPVLSLTTPKVFSDGIPFSEDRKHVTEDHTTFSLNKEQMKEVESKRKITLTSEQHQVLKGINPKVPQVLDVVTSRYSDCTCELGPAAVWCRDGEVDILHFLLKHPLPKGFEESSNNKNESFLMVVVDSEGKCYVDDKFISEEEIAKRIKTLSKKKEPYIWLDLPPILQKEKQKKIDAVEKRLKEQAKKNSVDISSGEISK